LKSIQLPDQLIKSLVELGLLESEAKIYAALVALNYASVSDLLDILDISKPRIYTSLGTLEKNGMIVQTSPRPVIYQAVAPNIVLEMIMKRYEDAKNEAMNHFQLLKQQEIKDRPEPPLFFIFGAKSMEFKIRDMLESAKDSVDCRTSEKYLKYIEKLAKKDVKVKLVVMSENQEIEERLNSLFKKGNAQVQVINRNQVASSHDDASESARKRLSIMNEMIDVENTFMLIVDDSEALMIPPLKNESLIALTSSNKGMISMMKMMAEPRLE
jgi:sugar-specific transcriptional regulator TrmB